MKFLWQEQPDDDVVRPYRYVKLKEDADPLLYVYGYEIDQTIYVEPGTKGIVIGKQGKMAKVQWDNKPKPSDVYHDRHWINDINDGWAVGMDKLKLI